MRIDPIGGGNQYYNYSPKISAQNKIKTNQPLTAKDTMSLLLKATACSSKEEAIKKSIKNFGRIYSWGIVLYKNGKRIS